MAKATPPPPEPSCLPQLTITTTPKVVDALKDLVASGLFGRNIADVAEGLVR